MTKTAQTIELPIVTLTFQADMEVIQQDENWQPLDDPMIKPYYEVNRKGQIRELTHDTPYVRRGKAQTRHVEGHIIKPHTNNSGYQIVTLQDKDGKPITKTVQQLVAQAWLTKPTATEKLEIDHINGNRLDNRVDNLQWLTVSQNRKKRVTPKNGYQGKKVMAKKDGVTTQYPSMQQAQLATGISASTIKGIAEGIIENSSTGFLFSFC
jgi:hypothetical protein